MEISTFNIKDTSYDCRKTWSLICEGRTKGVFQLESQLGRSWAKRLKPRNIEELAALSALLRPGCLKAIVDGKSMTQHYVDRKNGNEESTYLDESLKSILEPTYGVLVYQEQSMRIAQEIAGFNLEQADDLRKAIGKKKADLMAEVKKTFLRGCEDVSIVSKEIAEEIFSWIEKSNRYAFNKSHAVSYAVCGYWSAYCKAHFPLHFYCSYLYHSHGKQDQQQEVKELISDAKMHDIIVMPPKIDNLKSNFNIKNGNIYFGIQDVKYIGGSQVEKVIVGIKEIEKKYNQDIKDISWHRILINIADKINSNAMISLISIGALSSDYTITRNRMLYEFETWSSLTKKEKDWIRENCDEPKDLFPERGNKGLETALYRLAPTKKEGGGTHNSKRKDIVEDLLQLLETPPYELEDTPDWIATEEQKYLGASLTYSKIDGCDTGAANTTCKEFLDGRPGRAVLGVEIVSSREWTIKKGNSKGDVMAFLSVEDSTAPMDSVIVFPEAWSKNKSLLYPGNTVLLSGKKSSKDTTLIVEKVFQI
jgi:DNA polymerase III alpha subunit